MIAHNNMGSDSSYVMADRVEDATAADRIRADPLCDRDVVLFGYVRVPEEYYEEEGEGEEEGAVPVPEAAWKAGMATKATASFADHAASGRGGGGG
jgi:hypothetical protein